MVVVVGFPALPPPPLAPPSIRKFLFFNLSESAEANAGCNCNKEDASQCDLSEGSVCVVACCCFWTISAPSETTYPRTAAAAITLFSKFANIEDKSAVIPAIFSTPSPVPPPPAVSICGGGGGGGIINFAVNIGRTAEANVGWLLINASNCS